MIDNFELHNGLWINKQDICQSLPIDVSACKSIVSRGGLAVRNVFNWDKKEEGPFYFVIKDTFRGIDELPSKVRNQVKKSLKSYDIKKVPFEDMRDCGFELFNKSRSRFGVKSITLEQWNHKMSQLRKRHHDYWIGYDKESGKPASFAINRIYNDYIDYSTMGISPDFPNNTYPMYGLIYEMNRWYLEECKVPFVCDGSRSITEHSNIQSLLNDKFKFRKAYCDVQIFYKPWLGVLVKILFPLRCLFKQSKVSAILRQEAWARGFEQ